MSFLRFIRMTDWVVNILLLTFVLLVLAFAVYALWDSEQVHRNADKSRYEIYKPTAENKGKTFEELRDTNPEVIAWLTIFDTNVDYPVLQASDNMKYVSTNPEGNYSLSGSIFLDYRNASSFTDFNSIIYGHNMDKKTMFGEIGQFANQDFFQTHKYGNLHLDGHDFGLEFFAFVHTDAYNGRAFWPNVPENMRQEYLDGLLADAIQSRDIRISTDDRIILFGTCSGYSTNGRDILLGRISDQSFLPEVPDLEEGPYAIEFFASPVHLVTLLLKILLAAMIIMRVRRRK